MCNITKAKSLIDSAELLADKVHAYDLLTETLLQKSNFLAEIGRYKQSNEYLYRYIRMKDSLEVKSTIDRINNIKSSMESELNAAENRLLKKEQEKQSQYLSYQVIVIVTITLIILILAAYLFQYYKRLKQQKDHNNKLDKLNRIITRKNDQIEEINKNLDTRLISTSKMLQESQNIAKLGSWEYDVDTRELKWTDEVYNLLDLEPQSVTPTIELLSNYIKEKDFEELRNTLRKIEEIREKQLITIEATTASGTEKSVSIKIIPEEIDGHLSRVFGTTLDVTDRLKNEQKQREILRTLLELSKSANLKKTSLTGFIEDLLFKASQTIKVSRVSFWLFDEKSQSISCFRSYKGGKFMKEKHIHYVKDLPRYFKVLEESRTIAASDAYSDPRTEEFTHGYLQKYDIKSLLDAQVRLEDRFLGIVSFEKIKTAREWTFSDQRFAGSLADIIAMAFSSSENKKLVLEKEKLIETLVRKNQNLKEFAYVISHNLRDPVTQVMGLSNLLLENNLDKETREEVIKRIGEGSMKLDMVIKDLSIVLTSQEKTDKQFRKVKLKEIIDKTTWVFSEEINKINPEIILDFNNDLTLVGPLDYYSNMIYNLFSNSIKYRKPDEKLIITVSAIQEDHHCTIKFSDNGQGFDLEKYRDKIFKMYQRFHMDVDGRGIGLYIVKKQIEQLGGNIAVDSTSGNR